jgi:hypothetical protein
MGRGTLTQIGSALGIIAFLVNLPTLIESLSQWSPLIAQHRAWVQTSFVEIIAALPQPPDVRQNNFAMFGFWPLWIVALTFGFSMFVTQARMRYLNGGALPVSYYLYLSLLCIVALVLQLGLYHFVFDFSWRQAFDLVFATRWSESFDLALRKDIWYYTNALTLVAFVLFTVLVFVFRVGGERE